mgnify:CR=1 FL=1
MSTLARIARPLLTLVLAALVCHFLFYLAPGMLGMKTGLPLYIVGTSTFGAMGGFILPGFLMGVLQFGWLGVNVYFSALALGAFFGMSATSVGVKVIMVVWGVLAAFVGLKGIQYVAKVATYLPLIPLTILVLLLAKTGGNCAINIDPNDSPDARPIVEAEMGITSLQGLFDGKGETVLKRGDLRIEATVLMEEESRLLSAVVGSAAFRIEHTFFDFEEQPVSWGWFIIPGSCLRFDATVGARSATIHNVNH